MLSFEINPEDAAVIGEIAARARDLAASHRVLYKLLDARMDLTATHANGNPLKLHQLLAADDANFAHDVFGIRRHLNRETGELMDCFVPRFSRS